MSLENYILVDRKPVAEPDVLTWAVWFEDLNNRRVDETVIGKVKVSTIFLGTDHNFGADGPPILFETMVFGGPLGMEQDRYATWDEAEAGHKAMVERVLAKKAR